MKKFFIYFFFTIGWGLSFSLPVWSNPETAPSETSSTAESVDPQVKTRATSTYYTKKALLFPLELPAYILRGVTYPVLQLSRLMERTKFAEQVFDYYMNNNVVFYPILEAFGSNGLGWGVGVIAKDIGKGYRLDINYSMFTDLDQRTGFAISSPDYYFDDRPFRFEFYTRYRDKSDNPFYGVGPDSQEDDESDYAFDRVTTGIVAEYEVLPHLILRSPVEFLTTRTKSDDDDDDSVEQFFPPDELVALGVRTTYATFGLELIHTTRDAEFTPTRGGYRSLRFQRFQELGSNRFSFNELEIDLHHYFQLVYPRHVLAVRNDWYFQFGAGSGGIPFDMLRKLDYYAPLRGFPRGRFRDTSSVLFNFEYRYPIWDYIDGTLFVDTGKVFPGISGFNFDDWRYSVGGGIRLFYEDYVGMRLQAGYGGEGVQVLFRVGDVI